MFLLVNKETALGLLIGQYLRRWGKLNGMLGERRHSQIEMPQADGDRCADLPGKPLPRGDTQIKGNGLN